MFCKCFIFHVTTVLAEFIAVVVMETFVQGKILYLHTFFWVRKFNNLVF